jgi:hypothetical protein
MLPSPSRWLVAVPAVVALILTTLAPFAAALVSADAVTDDCTADAARRVEVDDAEPATATGSSASRPTSPR